MRFVHVKIVPDKLRDAWLHIVKMKEQIGWCGLTGDRRDLGTGIANYGGVIGVNPLTAFDERGVDDWIARNLHHIGRYGTSNRRTAEIIWCAISFYEADTDFAVELALRYGKGCTISNSFQVEESPTQ